MRAGRRRKEIEDEERDYTVVVAFCLLSASFVAPLSLSSVRHSVGLVVFDQW